METFVYIVWTLVLLGLIVGSCVVFTNAVENLGYSSGLNHGATGSILAAVGTALPETIVPLVAILGAILAGGDVAVGQEIGVGAILGAPFLLSTLAMFVTGVFVFIFYKLRLREKTMTTDASLVTRDLTFFLVAYSVAVLCGFTNIFPLKAVIAACLVMFYLFYAVRTIKKSCLDGVCGDEEPESLYFGAGVFKNLLPERFLIAAQVAVSILALIFFAHLFVGNIKYFSSEFGLNPLVLSLILSPMATELPEMFNSIIWSKSSKDTLAMNNITGAMVFQACIPTAIGILLTPWVFKDASMLNIALVYTSSLLLFGLIYVNKKAVSPLILVTSGMLYFVYVAWIFLFK